MRGINREEYLMSTFPLEDGTTYIQSLDEHLLCEYSGLPSVESYSKKEDSLCPKCQSIIRDMDGLCWKCLVDSNK